MARNQSVTDDDLDDAVEEIREQRDEIREDLEAAGVDVGADATPE